MIMRKIIEMVNKLVGKMRANRRAAVPKNLDSIRLNLGCGLAVEKNWINIDGSLNAFFATLPSKIYPLLYKISGANKYYSESDYCRLLADNIFLHHELSYGIPFNDNTIDFIYTSHFVEHLSRQNALNLLKDSYRVLKEGGMMRISIPVLQYAISLYSLGRKDEMLRQYFFVDDDGASFSQHRYMYDYELLSKILSNIGFADIKRCEFQVGLVPDCELLDNRPDESLFVEVTK